MPILAAYRELVAATLGEEGVLAVDDTDIPKDGTESVEVARQYCGQLGKRANCQAAVFAAYLGRGAAALVGRRLYLSRDWVSAESHAQRCQRTGVPADLHFRTKPQLVLEMLTALVAEGSLPVRWVTCDEGFGCSHAFLDGVAALGLGYLAEVPRTTHWTARPEPRGGSPSQEIGAVADALSPAAWRPFVLREGSKGPQAILGTVLRVVARRGREPGPDVWRLLRRNPITDELKCYLCNVPADSPRTGWCGWLACADRSSSASGTASSSSGWATTRAVAGRAGTAMPRSSCWPTSSWCWRGIGSPKTARPDHAPDLPAGGRGPAPHRLSSPPCLRHRGLLPGAQCGRPRAYAQRRQRYCECLFRQYEVSLHY